MHIDHHGNDDDNYDDDSGNDDDDDNNKHDGNNDDDNGEDDDNNYISSQVSHHSLPFPTSWSWVHSLSYDPQVNINILIYIKKHFAGFNIQY